ncbi:GNAT family N-acetyltransferase [Chloroflexota bacterium]
MNTETGIYLSPIEDKHIQHYMSFSSDPELIATMGWEPFLPNEKGRFIDFCKVLTLPNLKGSESVVFSITHTINDKPIGYVSIKGVNRVEGYAEIGIAIMDKKYRGKGYGTEALKQAVDHASNELGLTSLGLTVFPTNQVAIQAYKKVGFQETELLKNSWLLPNGEYADMLSMELSLVR